MSTIRPQSPGTVNANTTQANNDAGQMGNGTKEEEFIKAMDARIKEQNERINEYIKQHTAKLASLNARMYKHLEDQVAQRAETDKKIALMSARIAGNVAERARLRKVVAEAMQRTGKVQAKSAEHQVLAESALAFGDERDGNMA